MEHNDPPTPEPTAVTPQPPDATSPHVTTRPDDDPRWLTPKPPPNVGTSVVSVLLILSGCLVATCVLAALGGTWVLAIVALVALTASFHYLIWGRLLSRVVAEQQRQELLKLAERDEQGLPDPQRSRHF